MRIPNTEPSTANEPTAAIPEPAAEAADANHSSRMPRRSRAPSSEKTVTTSPLTMNTATAAWRKTCSRSPLRTPTIPAIPPRKM